MSLLEKKDKTLFDLKGFLQRSQRFRSAPRDIPPEGE